ncbi:MULTISPECIES: hypothetical protein [unclassified Sporosarcina]|uniref:hypothetical protein n=1 Tax=unclassified Sporosarcina TaxID=2647733 RepID=UPI00203CB0B5|nr:MULTISPECIES: hypothetical protein [unclassified Sporosarcina]
MKKSRQRRLGSQLRFGKDLGEKRTFCKMIRRIVFTLAGNHLKDFLLNQLVVSKGVERAFIGERKMIDDGLGTPGF